MDLSGHLKAAATKVLSIVFAAKTTTGNGTGVDLRGVNSATVLFVVGTHTDGTHTMRVEESDDNTTFTTVAAGELDGTPPVFADDSFDDSITEVGYKGTKRYIRAAATVATATTGAVYGAIVQTGHKKYP